MILRPLLATLLVLPTLASAQNDGHVARFCQPAEFHFQGERIFDISSMHRTTGNVLSHMFRNGYGAEIVEDRADITITGYVTDVRVRDADVVFTMGERYPYCGASPNASEEGPRLFNRSLFGLDVVQTADRMSEEAWAALRSQLAEIVAINEAVLTERQRGAEDALEEMSGVYARATAAFSTCTAMIMGVEEEVLCLRLVDLEIVATGMPGS